MNVGSISLSDEGELLEASPVEDCEAPFFFAKADGDKLEFDYQDQGDNEIIGSIKTDGSDYKNILEDAGTFASINVSGDWIYFCHSNADGTGMYRVKPDGTELTLVVNDAYGMINVIDNTIWFADGSRVMKYVLAQ